MAQYPSAVPIIYLSPSTQEWNSYVNGGTEEYYMNLIADAMEPYLRSSGIRYVRNTPQMTAASSIAQSNQAQYDLHLALHSNAAPESEAGSRRGAEVYYNPDSPSSQRAADLIAEQLRATYPFPWLVKTVAATNLGEVLRTNAPGVLIEYAYHDNPDDALWIREHIGELAQATVRALCEYFGIPFIYAQPARIGTVRVQWGYLNIRSRPTTQAPVIAKAWNGSTIIVLGGWENWYVVEYNGTTGYASSDYIVLRAR